MISFTKNKSEIRLKRHEKGQLRKKREEQAKKAEEMTALEDVKEGVADVASVFRKLNKGVEEIKEGLQEAESEVVETVHKLDEDVKGS